MNRPTRLAVRQFVLREIPIAALLVFFGIAYSASLNSYGMFMWDESQYASLARSVLRGEGFTISGIPNSVRPPILPLAGAASMWIFGEQSDDIVLRAANCAFALVALLCVYGIAARAFDRTTGLVTAALLGIVPFFWLFVPYFMCEIPFLAFFAMAVWFFYFGAYVHQRFFVWSWIAWGLAFLTRYTAALFLPVIVLFVAMAWWLGGAEARCRLRSRAFLLSPLAGFLIVLPWLLREFVTFGSPLAGIRHAATQLQDYMPEISMPWYFYLQRLPHMLSPQIAILLAAGIAWTLWKRDRFALHSFLTAALILIWFSVYRYKEDRMISSALPFLALLAALPVTKMTAGLRPLARGALLTALLAGFFVLNFRATRPVFRSTFAVGYPVFLDAMTFLRNHASPGAMVLGANSPQIYWYSDRRAKDIPEEKDLPEALRHSEWTVISNFEPVQKPYVLHLLDRIPVTQGPTDDAAVFSDGRTMTLVIRSDRLLRSLSP